MSTSVAMPANGLSNWTFSGLDRGTIVQPGSPPDKPLVAWTGARFAGNIPECWVYLQNPTS
jgi:hypothetical protein